MLQGVKDRMRLGYGLSGRNLVLTSHVFDHAPVAGCF